MARRASRCAGSDYFGMAVALWTVLAHALHLNACRNPPRDVGGDRHDGAVVHIRKVKAHCNLEQLKRGDSTCIDFYANHLADSFAVFGAAKNQLSLEFVEEIQNIDSNASLVCQTIAVCIIHK